MKILFFVAALLASVPALAADNVALASNVYVERSVTAANGSVSVVREEPKLVTPGDKLVFVLTYKNAGPAPADSFVVTNPIPASVSFVASDSPGADFSVDGGKSWGSLAALKVKAADGRLRPAAASDISAIRWAFAKAIAVGGTGNLIFRGIVR